MCGHHHPELSVARPGDDTMTGLPMVIDAHCDILLNAATQGFSLAEDLGPSSRPGSCTGFEENWYRVITNVVERGGEGGR